MSIKNKPAFSQEASAWYMLETLFYIGVIQVVLGVVAPVFGLPAEFTLGVIVAGLCIVLSVPITVFVVLRRPRLVIDEEEESE